MKRQGSDAGRNPTSSGSSREAGPASEASSSSPAPAASFPTKQAEGFKLMLYARNDCTRWEIIWNSREGITPFVARGGLSHAAWRCDVYEPYWVPRVGDLVWVDLTMDRAIEHRKAFMDRYWDDPEAQDFVESIIERMGGRGDRSEEEVRELVVLCLAKEDIESFAPHTPDLVEVTPELQEVFAERARAAGQPDEPRDPVEAWERNARSLHAAAVARGIERSR